MSHLEVSPRMCGPDALSLIQLLQAEGIVFVLDPGNPRIIHTSWDVEDLRELIEEHFKEGFISVQE